MNYTLETLLSQGVCCQKRTGKCHQFTVYFPEGPNGKIIKGPYSKDKIEKIMVRFNLLKTLNAPYIVYPERIFLQETVGYFTVSPNVGIEPFDQIETNLNEESFSDKKYKVLVRKDLQKVSDILRSNPKTEFILNAATMINQVFIWLFIMGSGDIGLYNVIANTKTKEIFVIDFDDDRGSTEIVPGPFFFIPRAPAKEVALIWETYVCWKLIYFLTHKYSNVFPPDRQDYIQKVLANIQANDKVNIGKMENHGLMGGSKTFSGYTLDVMKSGLQKYTRRADTYNALMCGFELYRMSEVTLPAGVSNMYNRLAVISVEDIGPANLPVVLSVIKTVLSIDRNPDRLACMIQILAESTKTRCISHISRTYNPEGRTLALQMNVQLDNVLPEGYVKWVKMSDDPDGLEDIITNFKYSIETQNLNAFTYMHLFLKKFYLPDKKTLKGKRRYNHKGADMILWEVLEKHLDSPVFKIMLEAYNTFSENAPFRNLAIFIAVKKLSVSHVFNSDAGTDLWRNNVILPILYSGRYILQIDDFVIDKHTKEGRSSGKDRNTFVSEGALVHPEDPRFMGNEFDVYKRIYQV